MGRKWKDKEIRMWNGDIKEQRSTKEYITETKVSGKLDEIAIFQVSTKNQEYVLLHNCDT